MEPPSDAEHPTAENHTATKPNEPKAAAATGSPAVRIPPKETGTPRPPPLLLPRATSSRDEEEAVTGSPTSNHPETRATVLRASIAREEAVTGSSARSPEIRAMPRPPAGEGRDVPPVFASLSSPVRSPYPEARRVHNQTPLRSLIEESRARFEAENPPTGENSVGSPMKEKLTMGAIILSPLSNVATEDPSLEKVTSPMVPAANRMVTRETASEAKVGEGGGGGKGSTWVMSRTSKQPPLVKAAFGFRIAALVLSMISFSIMAADKTYGWDGDSFDRYTEFRYCLSVNVLVFLYSLFQLFVQVHHMIMKKRIMSRLATYYFDIILDQIFAYLLMSASSSAASRNVVWVTDFGGDEFTKKINASIAMSFLAFFALAFSSIISTYKFFRWIS